MSKIIKNYATMSHEELGMLVFCWRNQVAADIEVPLYKPRLRHETIRRFQAGNILLSNTHDSSGTKFDKIYEIKKVTLTRKNIRLELTIRPLPTSVDATKDELLQLMNANQFNFDPPIIKQFDAFIDGYEWTSKSYQDDVDNGNRLLALLGQRSDAKTFLPYLEYLVHRLLHFEYQRIHAGGAKNGIS